MNSIVSTISTFSCRIKGVLNNCGKFADNPKAVGNLMNKNFVNYIDKLLEERKYDVICVKIMSIVLV